MSTFSTNQFYWHSDTKAFTADASEIFGHVYPIPTSFWLRSNETRKRVKVQRTVETVRNNDGDIMFWKFLPLPSDAIRQNFVVYIYND